MTLAATAAITFAAAGNATSQRAAPLPSLAELQAIKFEASAPFDGNDIPNLPEVQNALDSFDLFHQGLSSVTGWQWRGAPPTRSATDTKVYNAATNAVVYIQTSTGKTENGNQVVDTGAGVVLSPSGLILTASHVVSAALEFRQENGKTVVYTVRPIIVFLKPAGAVEPNFTTGYKAEVEFNKTGADLALLRLVQPPLTAGLKIGAMSALDVGQDIHVIGHPGGVYWTYSSGIISQIRKKFQWAADGKSYAANVLQLQAAINTGNSGGPVLDDNANIVGIVSFGANDLISVDFAIAADELQRFVDARNEWAATRAAPQVRPPIWGLPLEATGPDGRRVIRIPWQKRTIYMILGKDGKPQGVVAEAQGTVVRASSPTATGGYAQWTAEFPDGTIAEGSGTGGVPTTFQARTKDQSR